MMNISKITKVLSLFLATTAFLLVSGNMMESFSQTKGGRDPFATAPHQKKASKTTRSAVSPKGKTSGKPVKKVPKGPYVVDAPPIEARIDYYKRVRQEAATNGQPLPKVTSVLLVNEMAVTGVFKTPRGYAAIVEATPIKLSYTIYPGEKFFDGQLVAVEENRLVFRKVTKWSNKKYVSSVENMPLRKYSMLQEIQGTSPNDPAPAKDKTKPQSANSSSPDPNKKSVTPGVIVSPLEEMNNQPEEEKDSAKSEKKDSKRGKKGKGRASKRKKRS